MRLVQRGATDQVGHGARCYRKGIRLKEQPVRFPGKLAHTLRAVFAFDRVLQICGSCGQFRVQWMRRQGLHLTLRPRRELPHFSVLSSTDDRSILDGAGVVYSDIVEQLPELPDLRFGQFGFCMCRASQEAAESRDVNEPTPNGVLHNEKPDQM